MKRVFILMIMKIESNITVVEFWAGRCILFARLDLLCVREGITCTADIDGHFCLYI